MTFGTSAFASSENQAASIIGHELVHVVPPWPFWASECDAYTWELDHSQQTDGTFVLTFQPPTEGTLDVPAGGCQTVSVTATIPDTAGAGEEALVELTAVSTPDEDPPPECHPVLGSIAAEPTPCYATATVTVLRLELEVKEITFNGNHTMYESAEPYDGDNNGWGVGSALTGVDWKSDENPDHPICYTRSSPMNMTVLMEVKAARVHLVDTSEPDRQSIPTDRLYWLIVARSTHTDEIKYFASNASASASLKDMMTVGFARWHVEKWFERAKQETGFGAFEVRTYTSLMRHWLCSRMAMYFLAAQTQRLRGKNPRVTLEQVADVANTLAWRIWSRWPHSLSYVAQHCEYYQERNEASYESRRRTAARADTS
ncbi:MAG: hypothetical protein WBE26_03740 [Phycisphaerae bacterium]